MAVVQAAQLKEGMVIADDVYSKAGQLILPRNIILTSQMISHVAHYGIEEVTIIQGELPREVKADIEIKKEAERSYTNRILNTEEYQRFKKHYKAQVEILETQLNNLVLRSQDIDEELLLKETMELFAENYTTFTLLSMLHAMKEIDDSTYAHSTNVALIARMIGTWVGMDKKQLDILTLCGLLHDIGKCKISSEILSKPGRLTKEEFAMIRMHPQFGETVLKEQEINEQIRNVALLHHERYDGSGYPFGYEGSKLDELTCIVSIADVYDAMTSHRSYRSALCPFDVIATFEQEGLTKYHPKFISIFLQKIANSYLNSDIMLSDETRARIIYINKKLTRPIVETEDHVVINLEERPDLYIYAIV